MLNARARARFRACARAFYVPSVFDRNPSYLEGYLFNFSIIFVRSVLYLSRPALSVV